MNLSELINHLQRILDKRGDMLVEVLTEYDDTQTQMPCNDVAYSPRNNICIILGEKDV